jgi:CBS domain-containing protein
MRRLLVVLVSDLPIAPLLTVEPNVSLAEVARRMRVEDCDSVAVTEGGRMIGIVTERDLVGAIADGVDPRRARVALFMSPEPATVRDTEDIAVVAMRMIALGVRHLPVVDEAGLPIGLLSARALVTALEGSSLSPGGPAAT